MRLYDSHASGLYLRLLGYLKPHWRIFALSVLAMVALAATEWMLPALLKPLIDEDSPPPARSGSIPRRCCWSAVSSARSAQLRGHGGARLVSQRTAADMRLNMFHTLAGCPRRFDQRSAGELISKFTFDVTQVSQATTRVISVLVKDSAVVVVLLAYLLYLNWRLALACCCSRRRSRWSCGVSRDACG